MAAVVRLAALTRSAMANAVVGLIDAGATGGTIKLYDGSQPASADDPITTQVLLATLTFSVTSAPAAAAGVVTFNAITADALADAGGTVTWARIEDSTGANVFDANVGLAASTPAIVIDDTLIVINTPVSAVSFTLTMPAS